MEPHRKLFGTETFRPSFDGPPESYLEEALRFTSKFYPDEFRRIMITDFSSVTPDFFFCEFIWVVHASGFSAKTVGNVMPKLKKAYGKYDSLAVEPFESVFPRVRKVFNNRQKILSTHHGARMIMDGIRESGWTDFRDEKLSSPELLRAFPHIGKVTCFHLARNIGLLDFVKPDLHLVRMAKHWGFGDCTTMCEHMRDRSVSGKHLPLGLVDLALWYTASTFGTSTIK